VGVVALMAIPFIVVATVAINDCTRYDIDSVSQILQDPKAVHNPP
jgi:hypothetical protein